MKTSVRNHMKNKKGAVPIAAVVAVIIALIVLGAVVIFFVSSGGMQISKADAERIFQTQCQLYCDKINSKNNIEFSAQLKDQDPEFLQACEVVGVEWKDEKGEIPLRCLAACPCDVQVSAAEVNADISCRSRCVRQTSTAEELSSCIAAC